MAVSTKDRVPDTLSQTAVYTLEFLQRLDDVRGCTCFSMLYLDALAWKASKSRSYSLLMTSYTKVAMVTCDVVNTLIASAFEGPVPAVALFSPPLRDEHFMIGGYRYNIKKSPSLPVDSFPVGPLLPATADIGKAAVNTWQYNDDRCSMSVFVPPTCYCPAIIVVSVRSRTSYPLLSAGATSPTPVLPLRPLTKSLCAFRV